MCNDFSHVPMLAERSRRGSELETECDSPHGAPRDVGDYFSHYYFIFIFIFISLPELQKTTNTPPRPPPTSTERKKERKREREAEGNKRLKPNSKSSVHHLREEEKDQERKREKERKSHETFLQEDAKLREAGTYWQGLLRSRARFAERVMAGRSERIRLRQDEDKEKQLVVSEVNLLVELRHQHILRYTIASLTKPTQSCISLRRILRRRRSSPACQEMPFNCVSYHFFFHYLFLKVTLKLKKTLTVS